ncbi:MAG: gliding motility-associated C-terminal domain-containing protein, partial [Chitinophagales bacterium]
PSDSTFENQTSCNPSDTGVVVLNLNNQYGCDSVHTITTTLLPSDSTFESQTSCNPADAGVVVLSLSNQYGCDSVHTITTTLLNRLISNNTVQICDGESYFIGGENQTESGIYRDTLIAANGCDSIVVTNLNTFEFTLITKPVLDTIVVGESIDLEAYSDSFVNTYVWQPSDGLSCDDCPYPVASPDVSTNYIITATDINGCIDSSMISIFVKNAFTPDSDTAETCKKSFYIPNAFSPNGDQINDVFYAYGKGVDQIHLQIFNRWGELVFETYDINRGWDGIYEGELENPGVYVYYVKVIFCDGSTFVPFEYRKGSVTLLR